MSSKQTIILKKGEPSINGVITANSLKEASQMIKQPTQELSITVHDPDLFQPWELATIPISPRGKVTIEAPVAIDEQVLRQAFLLAGLTVQSEAKTATSKVWTASKLPSQVQSVALKQVAMIDEDDLLQEEGDWAPSTTPASKVADDDCGGREPCENCSCGRAENAKNSPALPVSSECGKCGMGDAFRCASCPYLGKPAFKPGQEHLVLDLHDDF